MAREYNQGIFTPKNPEKYIGSNLTNIVYRSGWEYNLMLLLDKHPNITGWASESLQIPYKNPVKGCWSVYIPDFLIIYTDKDGKQHSEIIEVKPLKETGFKKSISETRSTRDKLSIAVNHAKWQAAMAFCRKNGLTFRVMTEEQIFHSKSSLSAPKPKKARKPRATKKK